MTEHEPVICKRSEHNISRRDIDADALKVLYRLARHNHIAYLVGGGVRDLLLGCTPKDFDVSTDASPNQIRKMFKNCFLIGRRFRLAHIKYGTKIIETSTFRRQPEKQDGDLLQLNDNEFGTPEEDALRRDFTINGLFYNVENFCIIDYVGGLKDLKLRVVRSIGDPCIRFQEDPVRMVRAVRFASRLNFTIEEETNKAITEYAPELRKASAPRMIEEIYKLFGFNSGEKAIRLLYETSLLEIISPEVSGHITRKMKATGEEPPIWKYLKALDKGDLIVSKVSSALMLASIFFPAMLSRINKTDSAITHKSLLESFNTIVGPFLERYQVPRKTKERLAKILTMQHRFMVKGRKSFNKTRFVSLEWFTDALALHEIHLTAMGKDFSRADEWRKLWEERLEEIESRRQEGGSISTAEQSKRSRPRRGGRKRYNKRKKHTTSEQPVTQGENTTTVTSKQEVSKTQNTEVLRGIKPKKRPKKRKSNTNPAITDTHQGQPKPLNPMSILQESARKRADDH